MKPDRCKGQSEEIEIYFCLQEDLGEACVEAFQSLVRQQSHLSEVLPDAQCGLFLSEKDGVQANAGLRSLVMAHHE